MGKKRKRVPEVLWRLFRKRAQSLECTIESLLPSSEKAMSLLVRDKDPLQYRKLLNQCFLVVSENAPSLSHFNPHSRWSQSQVSLSLLSTYIICTTHTHSIFRIIVYCTYSLCFQIVQRTIEMLISEQPMSSNVICNGYDKAGFLSFFTYYCAYYVAINLFWQMGLAVFFFFFSFYGRYPHLFIYSVIIQPPLWNFYALQLGVFSYKGYFSVFFFFFFNYI